MNDLFAALEADRHARTYLTGPAREWEVLVAEHYELTAAKAAAQRIDYTGGLAFDVFLDELNREIAQVGLWREQEKRLAWEAEQRGDLERARTYRRAG